MDEIELVKKTAEAVARDVGTISAIMIAGMRPNDIRGKIYAFGITASLIALYVRSAYEAGESDEEEILKDTMLKLEFSVLKMMKGRNAQNT